jgi:hypothetical protein
MNWGSIRSRLARLERQQPPAFVSIWDIMAGAPMPADPIQIDPRQRAAVEEVLARYPDGIVPDTVGERIKAVLERRKAERQLLRELPPTEPTPPVNRLEDEPSTNGDGHA